MSDPMAFLLGAGAASAVLGALTVFVARAPYRRLARDKAILRAISEGHRFGLDIAKAAGRRSGSIHPSLSRLEASGLIVGDEWVPQENGRSRRAYRVTVAGAQSSLIAEP